MAEILHTLVPLMRDLGLDARWYVVEGPEEYFHVTKAIHNGLQGAEVGLTEAMRGLYLQVNEANAAEFPDDWDVVVLHDPQPAALPRFLRPGPRWVWRCHIDLTTPHADVLAFLLPLLEGYDASVFSHPAYVPRDYGSPRIAIIPPSIDPLSDKNRPVLDEERERVLARFPVDPDRPVLSQVGRFDPWKDPLGVINAYRKLKADLPDLQLLLVGSMARDDPEGWIYYERTARHAGEDWDIHLLTDIHGIHALEVNVLQRESDVGMLKSIREGFGLTVSESLWKNVPVVGGHCGGIPLQVTDGVTGFLVRSVEEAAERTRTLLGDPDLRTRMGAAGREHVRRLFLVTRHLQDYLQLFRDLGLGR